MGRKIFVSYKYADSNVRQFNDLSNLFRERDTVRSYVDVLETYLKCNSEHIYKGESDGEDLSQLSDATIKDKLYSRICDSTITIVMLSPNMKEEYILQKNQWIPQEISYSLREQSRTNSSGQMVTSNTNAILAIIVPDRNNSYSYFYNHCSMCNSNCIVYNTGWLFPIIRENTFNIKNPESEPCSSKNSTIYHGEASYIVYVKWEDFKGNEERHIQKALDLQSEKDKYTIHIQL